MFRSIKGIYKLRNPNKYLGDKSNVVYRSLLERRFMEFFDSSVSIVNWSSEELHIPYYNPVKGKISRYFPDFLVKVKTKDGTIENWLVEIKPDSQTRPPKTTKSTRVLVEWAINSSKWNSAQEYCQKNNLKFVILTEKNISKT